MKLNGKAEEVGNRLIESFKSGTAPKAISQIFIDFHGERHCSSWSWTNRLITYLHGYTDARTYKGWEVEGRQVRKGESAFYIFEPLSKKFENTDGSEYTRVFGFRGGPRFGIEQTDGPPIPESTEEASFLSSLPFMELAEKHGLGVVTFNGGDSGRLGYYSKDNIGLGTRNLSTWAHELVHWADDQLGNLKEKGQHWASETVAELGGCILLHMTGYHEEADDGGAWEYVKTYAERNELDPVDACIRMLNRTCDAVDRILEEVNKEGE